MTIAESHQTWRLTLLEEGKTTQNSNSLKWSIKKWIRGFVGIVSPSEEEKNINHDESDSIFEITKNTSLYL